MSYSDVPFPNVTNFALKSKQENEENEENEFYFIISFLFSWRKKKNSHLNMPVLYGYLAKQNKNKKKQQI